MNNSFSIVLLHYVQYNCKKQNIFFILFAVRGYAKTYLDINITKTLKVLKKER